MRLGTCGPCEHVSFNFSSLQPMPVPHLSVHSSPPVSFPLVPRAVVSFWRKTELSFPQAPMTSQGGPTTSCAGPRPRSSRRHTSPWGIGAIRTCSELAQRLCCPPVVCPGDWPQCTGPAPAPPHCFLWDSPLSRAKGWPLAPTAPYPGLSHISGSGAPAPV